MSRLPPQYLFKLFRRLERISAYAQGKGYGGRKTVGREAKLVLQELSDRPTLAIDIGGNVGEYTAALREENLDLEVHIFEPASKTLVELKARFANEKNIIIAPYAVSNKTGISTLFANAPGSRLSSLTKRRLEHVNLPFSYEETVRTLRFDEYWKEHLNRRKIDIAKIDVEGHEADVLEGFGDAIQATGIIQFEFGGCNIDTQTHFQDFWYFFKDSGFNLFRITPLGLERIDHYRESDEFFSTTNYVAINRHKAQVVLA